MRMPMRTLPLSLLAAGLAGCATVIHGTTQQVRFESAPPGVTASAGSQTVTTPGELKLARDRSYEVTFEKPGYVSAHSHIGQTESGAVYGNILLGGLIGLLVDYSNGAAYDLQPATVFATLVVDPAMGTPVAKTDSAPTATPAQQP